MKNLNMETAIKRYNRIMEACMREEKTIGELLSRDTENYGLADMLREAQNVYDTYFEWGHCNHDMKNEDETCRKAWYRETGMLKRFIDTYKKFV